MIDRRAFASGLLSAGACLPSAPLMAPAAKARNIGPRHTGSSPMAPLGSKSYRICRLRGFNVTSVQQPLTTLPKPSRLAERCLTGSRVPTVLVGHSFAGMIVTDAGSAPNVTRACLCRCAARRQRGGLCLTR